METCVSRHSVIVISCSWWMAKQAGRDAIRHIGQKGVGGAQAKDLKARLHHLRGIGSTPWFVVYEWMWSVGGMCKVKLTGWYDKDGPATDTPRPRG